MNATARRLARLEEDATPAGLLEEPLAVRGDVARPKGGGGQAQFTRNAPYILLGYAYEALRSSTTVARSLAAEAEGKLGLSWLHGTVS